MTLTQLLQYRDARLVWVKRDTRWDVYPGEEPTQLALHNYEGMWLPSHGQPGQWYKSACGYIVQRDACTPALTGEWRSEEISKCHGKPILSWRFEASAA